MRNKKDNHVRIKWLHIKDYKGIDELEINFLGPVMVGDTDVEVMGSRNGLGKTSVLECCTLLFIGLSANKREIDLREIREMSFDLTGMIIRAGAESAKIEGKIVIGNKETTVSITINKNGKILFNNDSKNQLKYIDINEIKLIRHFVSIMTGMNPNPILAHFFLYFHSYRKVQEGNLELGLMVEEEDVPRRFRPIGFDLPVSIFKMQILRSMMSKANLFEKLPDDQSKDILEELNKLVKHYAGGEFTKLRPFADNRVDFRIKPDGSGNTYTFDGLSSGQKEIIATMFLIWYQTRNKPCIVLIDEPELHLNPEWQMDFVRQLGNIAPNNQYLIATHSEAIFGSVDKDHRFLLQNTPTPGVNS